MARNDLKRVQAFALETMVASQRDRYDGKITLSKAVEELMPKLGFNVTVHNMRGAFQTVGINWIAESKLATKEARADELRNLARLVAACNTLANSHEKLIKELQDQIAALQLRCEVLESLTPKAYFAGNPRG